MSVAGNEMPVAGNDMHRFILRENKRTLRKNNRDCEFRYCPITPIRVSLSNTYNCQVIERSLDIIFVS